MPDLVESYASFKACSEIAKYDTLFANLLPVRDLFYMSNASSPPDHAIDVNHGPEGSVPSVPLTSIELPYAQWSNTIALFAPFANEPWAMLLDSAGSAHHDSRYDILVRKPSSLLVRQFDIEGSNSPFEQLKQELAEFSPYQGSHELPFRGGALGYFGYDAARWHEAIRPAPRAKPVAAADKPTHSTSAGSAAINDIAVPDVAVGFYQHALIIDHQQRKAYALGPKDQLSLAWVEAMWRPQAALGTLDFALQGEWQSNMTEAEYLTKIAQIKDHLNAGDCYQINLAQRFQAPYQGDLWPAYQALRSANQAPFSAFICLPEGHVISVSPERFIQTGKDGRVQTKPIKGTRPRSADAKQDALNRASLQASAKDQAENLMIVDLLRNDLSRVCQSGSVRVPKLFALESFAAVHHLVSTIEGQLPSPLDSVDLLQAAFPGGSITGAPKVSAMNIIESLEPHRRHVYCGSIGYINQDGSSDTNIAIRTLIAQSNQLYCWAGGGIVLDSEASAEYQETFDKVARILPVLSALNAGLTPLE